jgi:hypothetical protein
MYPGDMIYCNKYVIGFYRTFRSIIILNRCDNEKWPYMEKQWRPPGKKRKGGKKPKPEEQGGMPQHQHCPPAKRREDRNPKCHEKLQQDVARILAAHPYPPKNVEKEQMLLIRDNPPLCVFA